MQYTIDEAFMKKTVFFITAPTMAVTLAVLAKGLTVNNCVLITHPNYTDRYMKIMENILKDTVIKNIYKIEIPFFYTTLNNNNLLEAYKQIRQCDVIIQKFDDQYFDNKLFSGKYNLVCHFYCPMVSLRKPPIKNIYLMDHGPADALSRIEIGVDGQKKRKKILSFARKIKGMTHINIKLFRKYLNSKYPYVFKLNLIKQGFTNSRSVVSDTFMYVDMRQYRYVDNISCVGMKIKAGKKKTLLLVDHPKMFEDLKEIYNEMINFDWVNFLATIVNRHVSKDEIIIFKCHPNMASKLSDDGKSEFIKCLKERLYNDGYKNVTGFNELFEDENKIDGFPVESFVGTLGINKIVGDISSVHTIVAQWKDPNIKVISDCNGCESLEKIRENSRVLINEYMKCV